MGLQKHETSYSLHLVGRFFFSLQTRSNRKCPFLLYVQLKILMEKKKNLCDVGVFSLSGLKNP